MRVLTTSFATAYDKNHIPNAAGPTNRVARISMPDGTPMQPLLLQSLLFVESEGLREVGELVGRLSADLDAGDCGTLLEMREGRG